MKNVIPAFIYPTVEKKFFRDIIRSGEGAQWVKALEESTVEGGTSSQNSSSDFHTSILTGEHRH